MRNRIAATTLLGVSLAFATVAALAEDRPAEAIVKDIDSIQRPALDREKMQDRAQVQKYMRELQEYRAKRGGYILELLRSHPEHERLAALLQERWRDPNLLATEPAQSLIEEADKAIAEVKDDTVRAAGLYLKAAASMRLNPAHPEQTLPSIDEAAKAAPQDPRIAGLLYGVSRGTKDESLRKELEDRILRDYPNVPLADSIKGRRKQREAIGKPFPLEFVDAIKGTNVSIAGLKGKVVVIDFWATWCGPCVQELPTMKELYAKYRDQGVEFIGVSLDQPEAKGGLKALKDFVAKNEVSWPQYYQGKAWESEFSSGWGINAIPALFVVDRDGNLASVEARGKLQELIPELLAKGSTPSP